MDIIRPFPNQVKPLGIPTIDGCHPLAHGLEFFGFDTGQGVVLDLVSGVRAVINGSNLLVQTGTWGQGFKSDTNASLYWPMASLPQGSKLQALTAAGNYSFAGGFFVSQTTDGTIMGRTANNGNTNNSNWSFGINAGIYKSTLQTSGGRLTCGNGSVITVGNGVFNYIGMGCTVSPTTERVFVNGKFDATAAMTPASVDSGDPIVFGSASSIDNTRGMIGISYWMGFWSRILSDSEMSLLWHRPYAPLRQRGF